MNLFFVGAVTVLFDEKKVSWLKQHGPTESRHVVLPMQEVRRKDGAAGLAYKGSTNMRLSAQTIVVQLRSTRQLRTSHHLFPISLTCHSALCTRTDQSMTKPTFCALCAAPCDSTSPHWLGSYRVLGVGCGLISSTPSTLPPISNVHDSPNGNDPATPPCPNRCVTIHNYCLGIALWMVHGLDVSGEDFLLSWCLPKHTGWGAWDGVE